MSFKIRSIAIIAEGIPENLTRQIIKEADKKGVFVIGPATVGDTYYCKILTLVSFINKNITFTS